MPNISKQRLGLWIAHGLAGRNPGGALAILCRTENQGGNFALRIEAIAIEAAGRQAWDTHTAIVNLLQQAAETGTATSNREIFVTAPPSQACLSIAKAFDIGRVMYFAAAGPAMINVRNTASVAAMVAGALPAVANPNAINWPGAFVALPGTFAGAAAPAPAAAAAWLNACSLQIEFMRMGGGLGGPYAALELTIDDWVNAQGSPMWHSLPALPAFGVAIAGAGGVVAQATADRIFMALAYVVASRSWSGPSGPNLRPAHGVAAGFNIAGVLASPSGAIHGWGVNTNAQNSSRHAETNLVQSLGAIPAGATLYATLEPCYMCAGLFVHAGGARCIYGQRDPNMVNNTALAPMERQEDFVSTAGVAPAATSVGTHLDALNLRQTVAAQAARTAQLWGVGGLPRPPGAPVIPAAPAAAAQARLQMARSTAQMNVRAPQFLGGWTAMQVFSHAEQNLATQILRAVAVGPATPALMTVVTNTFAVLRQANLGTVAAAMQQMLPV